MAPKPPDEISASRFRALAFRNPFAASTSTAYTNSNLSWSPSPIRSAHNSTLPISISTATSPTAVSTAASRTPSAASSPQSEDYPDIEQHEYEPYASTPKRRGIPIPPGKMRKTSIGGDVANSFESFGVSPRGNTRRDSGLGIFESCFFQSPGTAVDGGADSLQSNMSTSMSAKLSPIRLSASPLTISRPTSLTGSFKSDQSIRTMRSYASSVGDGGEWDFDCLLDMTDEVRTVVRAKGIVPNGNIEELNLLLDTFLREEVLPRPATDIDLIIHTRFDQLLKEILDSRDTMCIDRGQEAIFTKSAFLKRRWEKRFKGLYLNIQKPRMEQMKTNGALRGLTLATCDEGHGQTWLVTYTQPAGLEGHLNFTPGDWWLNMHCALRDGAVGSVDKMLTSGKSGVVALALLTGEEINGPTPKMFEYTKIDQRMGELMKLVGCNRGHPIRVFRGSNLMSKYAPKAGIRYDGLHVIKQFGHKLLDESKNMYRCTIMLERVPHQMPMHEVLRLPKPSQLDDWDLYKKMISEWYRNREGDVALSMLKEHEEEEETDKEQFIKSKALQEGIRKYTVLERKPSYLGDG